LRRVFCFATPLQSVWEDDVNGELEGMPSIITTSQQTALAPEVAALVDQGMEVRLLRVSDGEDEEEGSRLTDANVLLFYDPDEPPRLGTFYWNEIRGGHIEGDTTTAAFSAAAIGDTAMSSSLRLKDPKRSFAVRTVTDVFMGNSNAKKLFGLMRADNHCCFSLQLKQVVGAGAAAAAAPQKTMLYFVTKTPEQRDTFTGALKQIFLSGEAIRAAVSSPAHVANDAGPHNSDSRVSVTSNILLVAKPFQLLVSEESAAALSAPGGAPVFPPPPSATLRPIWLWYDPLAATEGENANLRPHRRNLGALRYVFHIDGPNSPTAPGKEKELMGFHHPQSFPREQVMPLRHLRDITKGLQTEAFKSPAGQLALSTLLVERPNSLCVSLVAGTTQRKVSAAAAAAASSAVDPCAAAASSVDLVWNLVAASQTARDEFAQALKNIFVSKGGPRAIVDLELPASSVVAAASAAAKVAPANSSSASSGLERGISCRIVCTDADADDDDDAGALEGEGAAISAALGEANNNVRVRRVFLWLDLSTGGRSGTLFWSSSSLQEEHRPPALAISDADRSRNSLRLDRI
jgi:hypothetical protein